MLGLVLGWLSVGIISAFVVLLPMRFARLWRGPNPFPTDAPAWWSFGNETWRGYVRAIPFFAAVGGPLLAIAGWCFMLLSTVRGNAIVANDAARGVLQGLLAFAAAGEVLTFALVITIVLFNQPRTFVPPYFRSHRGALNEWLTKK